jgi:hypothetical protein
MISDDENEFVPPEDKRIKVSILVPMTSRKQDWLELGDCSFIKTLLPNFLRTREENLFNYTFYIGLDDDDEYFMKNKKLLKRRLRKHDKVFVQKGFQGNPCGYWNYLMKEAYNDGNEYFIQYGDDIKMLTPKFTSYYITILKNNNDFGIVGGVDYNFWLERLMINKIGIIENLCCSRKHYEMLGYMFNPEFKTWFSDDWISGVYYNMCFTCPNIKFTNTNRVGGHNPNSRYTPNMNDEKNLQMKIKEDQRKIYNYVKNNKMVTKLNKDYFKHLHSLF